MPVHYYLNTRPEYPDTRPVSVLIYLVWNRSRRLRVALPITVAPKHWSGKHERLKPSAPGATAINGALARIKGEAAALMLSGGSTDAVRAALLAELGRAPLEAVPTVAELLDAFLAYKAERVREATMQVGRTMRRHVFEWIPETTLITKVGPGFLDDFATYLLAAGLGNSSVNKLTAKLKGFLKWCHKRGHLSKVPETSALPTAKNAALFVTWDELEALHTVDLSSEQPGYNAARTLFLLGCYTGQRFSDVAAMQWDQLDLAAGWWNAPVKKTNMVKRVPLAQPARVLIEARCGEAVPVPRLTNQKANQYIKAVAEMAGMDTPVTVQRLRGGVQERLTRPKHEVLTTHVARKSFVTLMLQSGVPMNELLGLTHNDLRTLKLYAGQSDTERRKHIDRVFA
ncbi:MAG: tyrosine-type recombinase/integrase [Bacteroidota bacterium]